jgi:predicted Fe-Mo cluster-binding NifX family protein
MKIAVPVDEYRGLESQVYGHFGTAPTFVLVDSETMAVEALDNPNAVHEHGHCSPLRALGAARPGAVLVGGIGMGAVIGLRQAGIGVWRAPQGTVADAIRLFNKGQLEEVGDRATCQCSH